MEQETLPNVNVMPTAPRKRPSIYDAEVEKAARQEFKPSLIEYLGGNQSDAYIEDCMVSIESSIERSDGMYFALNDDDRYQVLKGLDDDSWYPLDDALFRLVEKYARIRVQAYDEAIKNWTNDIGLVGDMYSIGTKVSFKKNGKDSVGVIIKAFPDKGAYIVNSQEFGHLPIDDQFKTLKGASGTMGFYLEHEKLTLVE